jgi:hypothetical protein
VTLAIVASLAVIVVQLLALRTSLTEERQRAVMSEVQTAASIVKNFAAAAEISRNIEQTSSSTAQVAENINDVSRVAAQTGTASGEC